MARLVEVTETPSSSPRLVEVDSIPGMEKDRSFIDDLSRQGGLTLRAAANGLMGIPLVVGNGLNSVIDYGLAKIGSNKRLGSASDAFNGLLDTAGLPTPETKTERVSGDVASALAGTGGIFKAAQSVAPLITNPIGKGVANVLATDPTAQAVSGLVGPATSSIAKENGAGPGWQLGLGMMAGMTAPTAASAVAAGGRGVSALTQPLTKAGREDIVGRLLRDFASNDAVAMRNLGNTVEYVPGSLPGTASAARDPGLVNVDRAARGFDKNGIIAAQESANNTARQRLFANAAGPEGASGSIINNVENKRAAFADNVLNNQIWPNRQMADPTVIFNRIDQLLDSPAGSGQLARTKLTELRKELEALGDKAYDPKYLYDAYRKTLQNVRDNVLNPDKPLDRNTKRLIGDLTATVDDVINSAAPGFKDYLSRYANISKPISQVELLNKLRFNGTSKVGSDSQGNSLFNNSFSSIMRNPATVKSMDEAGVSSAQRGIIDRIASDIDQATFNVTNVNKSYGSDTFKNMTMANLVGRFLNGSIDEANMPAWLKPMGILYSIPEEQVRTILVDAMRDPKLALRLMQKVGPAPVETLAGEIKRRAVNQGIIQPMQQSY